MSVNATNASNGPYIGNGSTIAFPFTFNVGSADEVAVIADGAVVSPSLYTVTLNAGGQGGTVTYLTAPTTGMIVIASNPNFEQDISFLNAGAFLPETHDQALDQAARRDIYLKDAIETMPATFVAGYALNALATNTFLSKAAALAAVGGLTEGEAVQVYVDETKGYSWSIYRKVLGSLEYQFSISQTQNRNPPATGVFFDSSANPFTSLDYPANAKLVVTAGQAAFNSATAVALDMKVKRTDGSILDFAFDTFTVDATFTLTSYPVVDAPGVYVGSLNDSLGRYASQLKANPGITTQTLGLIFNADAQLGFGAVGYNFASGASIRVRYVKTGDQVNAIFTYPLTADDTITISQVFVATSFEMPRMFSAPLVRFAQANITLTSLKVLASYPNARFAFIGDSIVQGRFAATFAGAFSQKVRADHPGQVLIAGAPGAMTSDWLVNIQDILAMRPRFAFIMLGTNDFTNGRSVAAIQADYTTILNKLLDADISPIILTTPPKGDANVPILNTWLKSLGLRYIDIYPLLLGTGAAMNAAYDNGDGIHPNTAGNTVIYNAIASYIAAQGLVP
jgi:lysophospholipase L1-like esterase